MSYSSFPTKWQYLRLVWHVMHLNTLINLILSCHDFGSSPSPFSSLFLFGLFFGSSSRWFLLPWGYHIASSATARPRGGRRTWHPLTGVPKRNTDNQRQKTININSLLWKNKTTVILYSIGFLPCRQMQLHNPRSIEWWPSRSTEFIEYNRWHFQNPSSQLTSIISSSFLSPGESTSPVS